MKSLWTVIPLFVAVICLPACKRATDPASKVAQQASVDEHLPKPVYGKYTVYGTVLDGNGQPLRDLKLKAAFMQGEWMDFAMEVHEKSGTEGSVADFAVAAVTDVNGYFCANLNTTDFAVKSYPGTSPSSKVPRVAGLVLYSNSLEASTLRFLADKDGKPVLFNEEGVRQKPLDLGTVYLQPAKPSEPPRRG